MSLLSYDPSAYQKPSTPRKILTRNEGDEKLVEVVKIKTANDWGKAPMRRGPKIAVTGDSASSSGGEPSIANKFGDWFSHVKSDVQHLVEGDEDENVQIGAPSNFHQAAHIGWDPKKGFDLANIPPGWKQILDQAKVQKTELQDPVVSQAIITAATASVPPKPQPGRGPSPARKTSQGAQDHVLPDIDHVDSQARLAISNNIAAAVSNARRKDSAGAPQPRKDSASQQQRTHWSHTKHPLALLCSSYDKGWVCDMCNVPGLRGTPSWHCVTCEYDLCERCVNRPGPNGSPAYTLVAAVPSVPARAGGARDSSPTPQPAINRVPSPSPGSAPAPNIPRYPSPTPNPIARPTSSQPNSSATPPRHVSPGAPGPAVPARTSQPGASGGLQVPTPSQPGRVPSPSRPAPPVPSRPPPVSSYPAAAGAALAVPPASNPNANRAPSPARANVPPLPTTPAPVSGTPAASDKEKKTVSLAPPPVDPKRKPAAAPVDLSQQRKMMTKLASTYAIIPMKPKPQLSRQKTAVLNYKNTGRQFEDDEFPPSAKILHTPQQPVVWLRPREIDPDASLFVDGADAQDVQQGILGDCWFVGSLSVVVSRPKLFEKLYEMNREDELKAGAYAFKFYKFGTWHEVVIDDRLPCDPLKRTPLYSSSKNKKEMWVSLIEKAYAKWHGGYANILGGFVSKALMDLTGGVPSKFHLDEMQKEIKSGKLWDMMFNFQQNGCIMGCAYNPPSGVKPVERYGILPEHAYGILDVKLVGDKRLIKCRNPWGSGEWTGDYSDNSPLWTSRIAEAVHLEKADDGVFWMKYEDFCVYFNRLYTCRVFTDDMKVSVESEWKGVSAGGCLNYSTWRNNPQFMLQVREKGVAAVILEQEIIERDVNAVPSISFTVVKAPKNGGMTLEVEDELSDLEFTNNATVETEIPLEAGWYHILPQTFKPGAERRFVLSVYGIRAQLQQLPPDSHKKVSLKGQWKGKLTGGCRNNKTWQSNPKAKMQLSAADEVFVVLAQSDKKEKNAIGTYVFEDAEMTKLVTKSDFVKGTESTLRFSVASAKTLYVLPCTMNPGIEDTFVLELWTFKPATASYC